MSIIITSCRTCGNINITIEDLLLQAFDCDGDGRVYLRTYNPFALTQFCGQFTDYTAESRVVDGDTHTGFVITHSLNKLTALFLTVWDASGKQVTLTAEVIDANSIFLITDGLEEENGSFCIM
jgi:hypothetical protein